jgi:gamma-glutamyltranspeptidase/glutathione hydrolase
MIAGWRAAHERYGRLDFERLLAPAIAGAEDGVAVTPLTAWYFRDAAEILLGREETTRLFAPNGIPLRTGDVMIQRDLAETLRVIGTDPGAFYGGPLAEAVSATVREEGGWITPADMDAHRCDWVEPVSAPFGNWTVEEMPPNSQGIAALIGLRLLSDGHPDDEVAYLLRSVNAAKIMMAVRDAEIADPSAMHRLPAELLGEAYLAPLRDLAASRKPLNNETLETLLGRAAPRRQLAPRGDTVHFSIVDDAGLAVSCIQSVFDSFGSGIVVPGTGILLHNRGSSFSLDPEHVNALEGGKRPMHTLAPGMATRAGRAVAVFGCMGGHAQAQIHIQIVGAIAGQGLDSVAALERPRWSVGAMDVDGIDVEARGKAASILEASGYRVQRVEPFAQAMGHAQVILIDHESGTLIGTADPRSDGIALGY